MKGAPQVGGCWAAHSVISACASMRGSDAGHSRTVRGERRSRGCGTRRAQYGWARSAARRAAACRTTQELLVDRMLRETSSWEQSSRDAEQLGPHSNPPHPSPLPPLLSGGGAQRAQRCGDRGRLHRQDHWWVGWGCRAADGQRWLVCLHAGTCGLQTEAENWTDVCLASAALPSKPPHLFSPAQSINFSSRCISQSFILDWFDLLNQSTMCRVRQPRLPWAGHRQGRRRRLQ